MHPLQSRLLPLCTAMLLVGCSSSEQPDYPEDTSAPYLLVTSPERGTRTESELIRVEGQVFDEESGIQSVTISGVEASIDEDGGFSAEIAASSGLQLLHVVATDRAGNESTSTRALLSGHFAAPDSIVADALQVFIGESALAAIADTAEAVIAGQDIEALLAQANPVAQFGSSSCLQANLDVQALSYGDLEIALEPVDGGLQALVAISDFDADAQVHHKLACIGGTTRIDISAERIELEASLAISAESGELVAALEGSAARFENLQIDVGILPSDLIELVVGDLDEKLGNKLSEVIATKLPAIIEHNLEGLSSDRDVQLLGTQLEILARPSAVHFDSQGGSIRVETRVLGTGTGRPYISNPMPLPTLRKQLGIDVAVADDAVNQALSALWDAGALNREIPVASKSGADLGGGIFDRVRLRSSLPPVIATDSEGYLQLIVGDLFVSLLKDGESEPVSEIALNLEIGLSLRSDAGQLHLATASEPVLHIDRLDEEGFLSDRDLEILSAFASKALSGDLDALLGEMPLPSIEGTELADTTIVARDGYLQVGANLSR